MVVLTEALLKYFTGEEGGCTGENKKKSLSLSRKPEEGTPDMIGDFIFCLCLGDKEKEPAISGLLIVFCSKGMLLPFWGI